MAFSLSTVPIIYANVLLIAGWKAELVNKVWKIPSTTKWKWSVPSPFFHSLLFPHCMVTALHWIISWVFRLGPWEINWIHQRRAIPLKGTLRKLKSFRAQVRGALEQKGWGNLQAAWSKQVASLERSLLTCPTGSLSTSGGGWSV